LKKKAIAVDAEFLGERIHRGHTGDPTQKGDTEANFLHSVETVTPYTGFSQWPTDEPLPAWVNELSTVCEALSDVSLPNPPAGQPFERIIGRFVSWAVDDTPIENTGLIEPRAYEDLKHTLWCRLTEILAQPLHVDYCQFVSKDTDATVRLEDSTKLRESYAVEFVSGRYESFFEEFSLAGRFLVDTITRWKQSVSRLLSRLHSDRNILCRLTDSDSPFPVVELSADAGDRHGGGETVVVLSFGDENVVYKPRSIVPNQSLSQLFDALIDMSSLSVNPTPTGVTRDGYGWVEYVENKPLNSREQLQTYYDRAGVFAWMATLLGSTDLHYENLIATTAGPVVVDAETAISTLTGQTGHPSADAELKSWVLNQTVFKTGLVPLIGSNAQPDMSGFGATQPERMKRLQLRWVDAKMDSVDIRYDRPRTSPDHNYPRFCGDPVPPWLFADELTAGFRRAQETTQEHMETVRDAATTAFDGTKLRTVIRRSRSYRTLLDTLSNPKYLRDAVTHEQKLTETLWNDWSNCRLVDRDIARSEVIAAERDRLLNRDIPRFTVHSDERSLCLAGETVVENALKRTPIESLRRRIERLCNWQLQRQRDLLSLAVSNAGVPSSYDEEQS